MRGVPYKKVGRIISYPKKDLDDWRTAERVHAQQRQYFLLQTMPNHPDTDMPAVTYIALNSQLVSDLQAILEANQALLEKLLQKENGNEPMSTKEAAAYLKITRQTLATYTNTGAIILSEYGNRVWYLRSELDAFLARHQRKRSEK